MAVAIKDSSLMLVGVTCGLRHATDLDRVEIISA